MRETDYPFESRKSRGTVLKQCRDTEIWYYMAPYINKIKNFNFQNIQELCINRKQFLGSLQFAGIPKTFPGNAQIITDQIRS